MKEVVTNKETYETKAIIIATGAKNRSLKLDKEKELISVIRQKKNEEENILLGASNAENGIIVRLMAMSGEKIYNIFNEISGVV